MQNPFAILAAEEAEAETNKSVKEAGGLQSNIGILHQISTGSCHLSFAPRDIVARLHLSVAHLMRSFKIHTNLTPLKVSCTT
jgi:AraC-like DNA-binding protein